MCARNRIDGSSDGIHKNDDIEEEWWSGADVKTVPSNLLHTRNLLAYQIMMLSMHQWCLAYKWRINQPGIDYFYRLHSSGICPFSVVTKFCYAENDKSRLVVFPSALSSARSTKSGYICITWYVRPRFSAHNQPYRSLTHPHSHAYTLHTYIKYRGYNFDFLIMRVIRFSNKSNRKHLANGEAKKYRFFSSPQRLQSLYNIGL